MKLTRCWKDDVPEGLAVFLLPENHRRRRRTSNPIEHGVLIESDDKWGADTKALVKWEC